MSREVIVIGAGPSGLLTSYFLKRRGWKVSLLEASDRVGGWMRSTRKNRLLEWGPHTLLASEDWLKLFDELNLKPELCSSLSSKRFIWKGGRKCALPMSPISLIRTPLFSANAKFSLLTGLFRSIELPEEDLSIEAFFSRYLHRDFVDYAVAPFVGGVYAGRIEELSARASFSKLFESVRAKKGLLRGAMALQSKRKSKVRPKPISFSGGLEDLARALADHLGESLKLKARAESLQKTDLGWKVRAAGETYQAEHVILACPAFEVPQILGVESPSVLTDYLPRIRYERVGVWNTVFRRPQNFEGGFGCLIPRVEGIEMLGSLWPSEIFKARAGENELIATQFFAGASIPKEPLSSSLGFLQKLLGTTEAPLESEIRVHERAIPQLGLGHVKAIAQVRASLPRGVHLVGNYLDGAGLSAVYETASALCLELAPI